MKPNQQDTMQSYQESYNFLPKLTFSVRVSLNFFFYPTFFVGEELELPCMICVFVLYKSQHRVIYGPELHNPHQALPSQTIRCFPNWDL